MQEQDVSLSQYKIKFMLKSSVLNTKADCTAMTELLLGGQCAVKKVFLNQ